MQKKYDIIVAGCGCAGFAAADGVSATKFDHPLRAGQTVTVSSENAVRSSMPFGILYEDSDIIVINKSAGLLCVGNDREKERTAYRFLSDYMRAKNDGGRVYVIHRLDRNTSGIGEKAIIQIARQKLLQLCRKFLYRLMCQSTQHHMAEMIRLFLDGSSQFRMFVSVDYAPPGGDRINQLLILTKEKLQSIQPYLFPFFSG